MSSFRNLSTQFWGPNGLMFHISPVENRESIAKQGLLAKPPFSKSPLTGRGVYVSEEPLPFKRSDMDLYAVDTSHLPSIPDANFAIDRHRGARWLPGSIPTARLSRLEGDDFDRVYAMNNMHWKNPFKG